MKPNKYSTSIKIAITGANGFVAKHIRKTLRDLDISTVCIARKNFVTRRGEKKIITHDYSAEKILPALRNCTTMIHLAGSGQQTVTSDYHDSNTILTKKILSICKQSKIQRIIYNSGLGVAPNSTTGYFISKYQAEQLIKKSDLEYVIFRPSYIIGINDALIRHIILQKKRRRILIPGSGSYKIQPIFINDVVDILLDATISKKYINKTLDLVGPNIISFEDFVKKIAGEKYIVKTNLEEEYRLAIRGGMRFGFDDLCILISNYTSNSKPLEKIYGRKLQKLDNVLKTCGFT